MRPMHCHVFKLLNFNDLTFSAIYLMHYLATVSNCAPPPHPPTSVLQVRWWVIVICHICKEGELGAHRIFDVKCYYETIKKNKTKQHSVTLSKVSTCGPQTICQLFKLAFGHQIL